jgi:hypothetical protein
VQYLLPVAGNGRQRIRDNLVAFIDSLDSKVPWEIEVTKYAKPRTNPQNQALWGLAYPTLEKATGQSVNDWHEYMLGEKYGWVECVLFGKRRLKPARTTTTGFDGRPNKLSRAEFSDYYAFIQKRAAQNGIMIEDPDPLWWKDDVQAPIP